MRKMSLKQKQKTLETYLGDILAQNDRKKANVRLLPRIHEAKRDTFVLIR